MSKQTEKKRLKCIREQQKRLQPGECEKYVRLILDKQLKYAPYGAELHQALKEFPDLKYEYRNLPIKHLVLWERNLQQVTVTDIDSNDYSNEKWQEEEQVAQILTDSDLKQMTTSNLEQIKTDLQHIYPNKHPIILFSKPSEKTSRRTSQALIELQVMHQLTIMEVETGITNLAAELKRLSKAIAEAPYKKQKAEKLNTFRKYVANDKKQCVRVEGCNGLGRLWQQHLNRLPLVTLEVADAIITKYSCPKKLVDELQNNPECAIKDIAELRIKRSGTQALQTDRRIGPVLASKLLSLYTIKDPKTPL